MAERVRCEACVGKTAKKCETAYDTAVMGMITLDAADEYHIAQGRTVLCTKTSISVLEHAEGIGQNHFNKLGKLKCLLTREQDATDVYRAAAELREINPAGLDKIKNGLRLLLAPEM